MKLKWEIPELTSFLQRDSNQSQEAEKPSSMLGGSAENDLYSNARSSAEPAAAIRRHYVSMSQEQKVATLVVGVAPQKILIWHVYYTQEVRICRIP